MRAWPLSIRVPVLQAVPFQANTRPMESTARQKVAVGQDTAVSPDASVPVTGGSVAIDTGAVKPRPFQVSTLPLLSTRTQNDVVAQETELSWPWVSILLGWVQVRPFHTEGPPSPRRRRPGTRTRSGWRPPRPRGCPTTPAR